MILISYGGGGDHLLYRTINGFLAQNGFVVVAPEHPGNNRNSNPLHRRLQFEATIDAGTEPEGESLTLQRNDDLVFT